MKHPSTRPKPFVVMVQPSDLDIWTRWVLHERFRGDEERRKRVLAVLMPIRERLLDHANLQENDVLLDVGCGDGFIAFGALQRMPSLHAVFLDISPALLQRARILAREGGILSRCRFLVGSATALPLPEASVDVVTLRSVLIYVRDKARAFQEFYRVLKPGGRLSLFEPVHTFALEYDWPTTFRGYDVTPIADLVAKIKAVYRRLQPPGQDPMLDFDERRLWRLAEGAGFTHLHLAFHVDREPGPPESWEDFLYVPGNPRIPPLARVLEEVLTPQERERFERHLRSQVEVGKRLQVQAVVYLWAQKTR